MKARRSARRLLGLVAAAALTVLAACGGGTTGADAGPDPNGTIRVGTFLDLIGGTNFDPTRSATVSDQEYLQLVYGTLLRRYADGRYEPWMAESVEITDPRTLTVRLRAGLTFSDGSPFDANAVRAGLLRNRDQATERTKAGQNQLFRQLQDVAVTGPLALTLTIGAPVANDFRQVLAGRESMIVSPAADPGTLNTAPVGAGPFTLESFVPQQEILLARNRAYFDPDHYRLGKVQLVHTPNGPGRSNVLLSGDVDLVQPLSVADVTRFESAPYRTLKSIKDFGYTYFVMCTTKPPFDDLRIRQALQLGIDRNGVNQLLYAGQGQPAYGLWPADSPNYNPAVEQVVRFDPDRARQLVAESGLGGTPIELYWPTNVNLERLAEIVRVQLADIGLTIDVKPTRDIVAEFSAPQKPGAELLPGSRTGMDKYLRSLAPGAVQNLCGADQRGLVADVLAVGGAPDDAAAAAGYRDLELKIAQQAVLVPIAYEPEYVVWNEERLGGEVRVSGVNYGYDLQDAFVKATA
ncbi:ABC transporter substrate-binding protein [Pseudonocardia pini]|uniref:ABC transporter substrate-binding protein n=1 Tax=Pseudonocardia pini TaxID=2758030 RepID=UPI0015F0F99D|nr:ABC transporter substrate-binding protein [Pseudonocardia pini]